MQIPCCSGDGACWRSQQGSAGAWQDPAALCVWGRSRGSTGTVQAVLPWGNPAVTAKVTLIQGPCLAQTLGSRGLQVLLCSSKGITGPQPLPEIWGLWHSSALCPHGHGALVKVCTLSVPCQLKGHIFWLMPAAHSSGGDVFGAQHVPSTIASHSAGLRLLALAPWVC